MGKTKSCGCTDYITYRKNNQKKLDKKILGKKFGRLTPIRRLNDKSPYIYECNCDCGKTVKIRHYQLLSGKTKSCGCLKSELNRKNMEKIMHQGHETQEKLRYKGTKIVSLTQKKSKNNTSGYKGVSYIEKTGKYRAYINLRGKQKHLGNFDTAEEAYQARLEAQKEYFDPIIEEFEEENKEENKEE